MQFGLNENNIKLITSVFQKYPTINEVVIYGSRAKGNYTERSDIDLVVKNSPIERHVISNILMDLNDSDLPYLLDIQNFEEIKNQQLLEHINRVGQLLYKK
ncbi:MAG: nucleotidyltransferase domain-containing protein [Crocinitomicaceae bacterium]|nr:nucleotidyltransferase domain-containing protein [Crocinitomicaceae bacterium]